MAVTRNDASQKATLPGTRQAALYSAQLLAVGKPMLDTLFELVGGSHGIDAVMESLYKKVLSDPTLCPFFDRTDMAYQVTLQSMFISMLLGGSVVYPGREIRAAHARIRDLGLTDSHFDSFLNHFRAALQEQGVQPDGLKKVIALLESKRDEVLGR